MVVKIAVSGKIYDWDILEADAKKHLDEYGARHQINIRLNYRYEIKEFSIDPVTLGLLIGGGLVAGGTWAWYRFTQKEMVGFKESVGIAE